MPLSTDALATAFKTTFKDAQDQEWRSDEVAEALATAIGEFVKSGDVTQITVDVQDPNGIPLGTGTQSGSGRIE